MRRLLLALSAACALLVAAPAAKADWVLMITEDGWAYVYHDPSGGNDPPPPPPGPWRLMYQISGIWFGIY
ncbi:MAG: hypothetical protein U0796_01465 [Gemmatales bacterium]